ILDQVEGVRDESDRKSKLRLVIEPRSSRQNPEEMMAALLVNTSMESRYAVNLTWLGLDGLPETKGIVDILRRTVLTRNSPHSRRMSTMPLVSGRPSRPSQVRSGCTSC